jgi:hypothetical protein
MSRTRPGGYVLQSTRNHKYWCTGLRDPSKRGWHTHIGAATHFSNRTEAAKARLAINVDAYARATIAIIAHTRNEVETTTQPDTTSC